MAGESLIGNLAVLLTMDTSAFEKGTSQASKLLRRTQREFEQLGTKIKNVGQEMSTKLTLPIVGAGAAIIKMAGSFEASMNEVNIATKASAAEMAAMRKMALQIGKDTTKSASEAAGAMETLAKAGMRTTDILNGGAKAAVALAEAAGSDLEPAAAAITDTMQQFNKTTKELPGIINNITGAVNESKFGFQDFQMGMAQAGGVAASAGVEFEDFTAALAATASQFASGGDAGTSMKTFLLALTPSTAKAAKVFQEFGFNAYTATGQMKPLAQIAEELRIKFGHLSEEDLNATFKKAFGTDAIRTAIGLMKQGEAGITAMQDRIAKTDASAQAAQRMKGFNAELEKLKGAIETAAIAIADSGMLAAISSLVSGFADVIDKLGELSPATLKWITIIAGVVAVVGPVLMVVGTLTSTFGTLLPLLIKIAPALAVIKAAMIALSPVVWGAVKALAAMALTPVGAVITAVALAVTGAYLAWKNWDKIAPIVRNMVNGVTSWLGRLAAPFKMVIDKVKDVTAAFFTMWDKVTRRSYVPDMVDDIAREMDRLQPEMVDKAARATKQVTDKFKKMRDDLRGLLDRLFPEVGEAAAYRNDLGLIAAGQSAGLISEGTAAEARRRASGVQFEPFTVNDPGELGGAIDYDAIESLGANLPQFIEMADEWNLKLQEVASRGLHSIADGLTDVLMGTAKLGDVFRATIAGMLADLIRFQIQKLMMQGLDMAFGVGTGASLFGGARAKGGPVANNKAYLVGERGPELFMPGKSGQIIPNDRLGGGGSFTFINHARMSPEEARRTGRQAAVAYRTELARASREGY